MNDKKSVLIVDDDPAAAEAMSLLLAGEGFAVESVASAEEALARLREATYHLALCDLQLPGQSGLALIRAIREACPATPCVLVTGHGSLRTAITALKRGAVEYVTKPVRPRRLATLCRALVARLPERLPNRLRDPVGAFAADEAGAAAAGGDHDTITIPLGTPIDAVEREVILRTLDAHHGNKTAAAAALGISRRSIYNKLAEYGLHVGSASGDAALPVHAGHTAIDSIRQTG